MTISDVASTVVSMAGIMNCSFEKVWKNYLHSYIEEEIKKEQITFEMVEEYIKKKIALGEKYE